MILLSGSANKPLAENIALQLNISVSPLEIHVFPDGERRVRVEKNVVDQDVVVVQPTSMPVDTNYMELFFIVDAAKRSGARSVTVVIPYLGYQRQDHIFRSGEAVSLDVVITALQAVGVTKVIALDLHSIKIPEEFSVPITHLSVLPLFAEKIKKLQSDSGLQTTTDCVLVSPDMGGIRRIEILSKLVENMSWATIVKNRDLSTGSVTSDEVQGVLAKRAFIVDDMISSGGTIDATCELLAKNGVEEMYVLASHAIFSDKAPQILQSSKAEKIFVSDTVFVPSEKRFEKLEIISISGMIATQLKS